MIYRIIFLILICISLVSEGYAEQIQSIPKQMSVEKIQKLDQIEKAKESLKKLKQLSNSMTTRKYSDCFKAYGDEIFCQCLSQNLPIPVSFNLYIKIVTTPKDELGYSELNKEDKQMVDVTLQTRETCVGNK
ncbi:MAG: hypothetical protein PF482_13540 [Desulfobacteraceae bacterium]|jgi:hypothetical protein|nr:hypothetical protein [Desulfobacteraceae bacterium]